jgi:glycosyltransferase involved in cell wall biosynthesis
MQPLRILHVTPYYADAWAYGGIPRLARTLTRGLARRGHQVTVCTTDAHDARTRLPGLSTSLRAHPCDDEGIEVRVFPNVSNRLAYHQQLFLPRGLDRFLQEHASRFDVAHLHACRNIPGVIAARRLRRAGVPYVLAPNGTAPILERRKLAKQAFDTVVGRRMLHAASRVIAVTAAEQVQLRALGVDDRLVRVIPNPVDLDEFASPIARGAFRTRHALGSGPIVMFLGRITPRKRVDLLVRAFARITDPQARLVIAGNDPGSSDTVAPLLRAMGVTERSRVTGLLRGRERLEALADADVVVYPSEDEIFGLVPLEALLAGTPVVVAGGCGCGEVIRGLGGGGQVVPPSDHVELAAAIGRVLAAPAPWRAGAAASAIRVRDAFGEPIVAAAYETLYAELAAAA